MLKKILCLFLIICFLFISTGCVKGESERMDRQIVLVYFDSTGDIRIYRDVKTGVEYIKSGATSLVVRINADGTPYIEEEKR